MITGAASLPGNRSGSDNMLITNILEDHCLPIPASFPGGLPQPKSLNLLAFPVRNRQW